MTFEDIKFALGVNGVEENDIETLIQYSKNNGANYSKFDEMLLEMGYEKVFTDEVFGWVDSYDDDFNNDFDDNYDEDYFSNEKIRHRREWDE
jgi:hypothetical protein